MNDKTRRTLDGVGSRIREYFPREVRDNLETTIRENEVLVNLSSIGVRYTTGILEGFYNGDCVISRHCNKMSHLPGAMGQIFGELRKYL